MFWPRSGAREERVGRDEGRERWGSRGAARTEFAKRRRHERMDPLALPSIPRMSTLTAFFSLQNYLRKGQFHRASHACRSGRGRSRQQCERGRGETAAPYRSNLKFCTLPPLSSAYTQYEMVPRELLHVSSLKRRRAEKEVHASSLVGLAPSSRPPGGRSSSENINEKQKGEGVVSVFSRDGVL